jgi:hypothetical protein
MELNQPNTQPASNPMPQAETAAAPNTPQVFDAAEIQELSTIREAYEQLTLSLGQLEMQKREITKNEKRINDRIVLIEAQEKVFLDKIVARYGEGTFDVNTGVFTPKS